MATKRSSKATKQTATPASKSKKAVTKKAVTRKPVTRKAVSKKAVSKKAVSKKPSAKKTARVPVINLSAAERQTLIAKAAYLRAESRGFVPGGEVEDWVAAERQIDALQAR